MNEAVTVIDIVAQVTDQTESGARSAETNVSKLEKSMMNLQKQIQSMKGKSKLEVAATLRDMASKGIQNVAAAGKKIAGKVWTVTLKAVDLVTAPFKKVWGLISNPITQAAAFAGISVGLADTINTGMEFDKAMSQVAATMGYSADELNEVGSKANQTFERLRDTAKGMGATTAFTAAQAAEALNYMALAGYDSETSIAMLPNVLNLAMAGGLELAAASDMVTDAQSALGLTLEQTSELVDKMAIASSSSNTSVSQLGDAILAVGGTAKNLAGGTTELNAVLGVLADNGVKGSEGGTALRNVILSLTAPTGKAAAAIDNLGVKVFNTEGKMRELPDIFADINRGLGSMTPQGRIEALNDIFNKVDLKSVEGLLGTSTERWNELAAAIDNAKGAAERMANTQEDNLAGDIKSLQSAVDGVKLAIEEQLDPYLRSFFQWITGKMPDIERIAGSALNFITGKIDSVLEAVKTLTGSREWQNAETLWNKIKLAWDKLIAEPFDTWWSGTGKTWLADKTNSIGEGLGTALKSGILALLGIDIGGAAADGADIGKSFFEGFMQGFDWKKVVAELGKALKDGLKFLITDALSLLPGGKEASSTSALSAAALGYGALKTGHAATKVWEGGKAVAGGIKTARDIVSGVRTFNTAANGGHAAEVALGMAQSGQFGNAVKLGTTIAPAVNKVTKVIPVLAGVTSAIQTVADAYHGTQKAEEWTGSDSTGNKIASGIGAAVGGLGNGVFGNESTLRKASNIGGGALKGAGIGAAVGSFLPGVGTAIGAGVGGAIGAAGAAIGGSNIAKALSTAGGAVKGFFTETVPETFGEFADGTKSFFTEAVPQALSSAGNAVSGFFTETVPAKFEELANGVESFFTETVPFTIGYAAGKIQIFFTETVPEFFGNLWDGITNFFTETVPAAIETAGSAVSAFFTETVPNFFSGLWDGIVGFFTETVPSAIETVGSSADTFFSETVPQFFIGLWDGIAAFFTETVPGAITTVGEAVRAFFTETVPDFFSDLWNDIISFFTEAVPGAIASVGEGISGFFSNIKEKISGFFGGVWNSVTGSASAGYSAATAHAEGGIMTSPHVGLVAEDGAEAIIPLSNKRRERGIELWEQAGNMLGVKPYADGAITGNTEPVPYAEGNTGSSGMTVPVTIENLTFEINVSGGDTPDAQALVNTIRENVRGMTDEIAYQLAIAMKQSFANTPKEQWGG